MYQASIQERRIAPLAQKGGFAVKALRFTGGGAMELAERPMPEARDDWVVVRVMASGICGTDLELLLPHPSAVTPGHEVVGVVHAVDASRSVRPGQRAGIKTRRERPWRFSCLNTIP